MTKTHLELASNVSGALMNHLETMYPKVYVAMGDSCKRSVRNTVRAAALAAVNEAINQEREALKDFVAQRSNND